jgi:transposase InsO family protein
VSSTVSRRTWRHHADNNPLHTTPLSWGLFGRRPTVTAELRETGERVNHKRIARVMRSIGLSGARLRRRHRTTVADPAAVKAPDLSCLDFTASEPNRRHVDDFTYLPLDRGSSSIWPPSSTLLHAAWPAGLSRITCARTWSSTRLRRPGTDDGDGQTGRGCGHDNLTPGMRGAAKAGVPGQAEH